MASLMLLAPGVLPFVPATSGREEVVWPFLALSLCVRSASVLNVALRARLSPSSRCDGTRPVIGDLDWCVPLDEIEAFRRSKLVLFKLSRHHEFSDKTNPYSIRQIRQC